MKESSFEEKSLLKLIQKKNQSVEDAKAENLIAVVDFVDVPAKMEDDWNLSEGKCFLLLS